MLKILFHLVGALHFFYGCYYDYTHVRLPVVETMVTPFGNKFKYLTFLDAILHTVYFTVALVNDLIGNNENTPSEKPLIRRLKDTIFSSLLFPLATFVGMLFWGIYSIDRELILPRSLDPYFPLWLNHVMHTNIVIFTLIEMFTSFRMYPSKKKGLSILLGFMLCYFVWIHFIYYKTGSWVYPILKVLNWPMRILFYLFGVGFICMLYTLGNTINSMVWSKEVEAAVKSGKKKAK